MQQAPPPIAISIRGLYGNGHIEYKETVREACDL